MKSQKDSSPSFLLEINTSLSFHIFPNLIFMNVNDIPRNRGLEAMKEASRIASENGISDMTLDEINAEINEARNPVYE